MKIVKFDIISADLGSFNPSYFAATLQERANSLLTSSPTSDMITVNTTKVSVETGVTTDNDIITISCEVNGDHKVDNGVFERTVRRYLSSAAKETMESLVDSQVYTVKNFAIS